MAMFIRRVLFLIFSSASLFVTSALWAGTVGTTTADILKINQGARPAAMGGAYTALGDDAYCVNYNPAGLVGIRAPQLLLLHSDHLAFIGYEYFTFALPWGTSRALAANLTYRHTGTIDNPPLPGEPPNTPVSASDMLISLSGAQDFSGKFSVGLSLKYLDSRLADYKASAFAVDLGAKMMNLPYNLKAGLAIQNIGTSMDFVKNDVDNVKDPLPMFFRLGLSWGTKINKLKDLNVALDFFKPSDQQIKMALGAEFWLFEKLFAVRAGYKREGFSSKQIVDGDVTRTVGPSDNLFNNYTLGFSLTRAFEGTDFTLDFAYNPAAF
jgi:hypothetical protein